MNSRNPEITDPCTTSRRAQDTPITSTYQERPSSPCLNRIGRTAGVRPLLGDSLLSMPLPDICARPRARPDTNIFAVGTPIAESPPHRSERAQFGHSAPTLG